MPPGLYTTRGSVYVTELSGSQQTLNKPFVHTSVCMLLVAVLVAQLPLRLVAMQVDVPPVLFGYVADNGRPASLALYLTLKPRLAPPAVELLDDSFTPGEQGNVTRHARK